LPTVSDDDDAVATKGGKKEKSEEELRDRQMLELLNELRIALPGVQILFAFLLTVPFTMRYGDLSFFQRDVFYVTLVATALSTACLIAPTAAHRFRFHKRDRAWIVETASTLMTVGLGFLAVAIGGAILMITDMMFDGTRVWVYSGALWLVIAGLWFVRPALRRESSGP
jgi:hypothetical protein